MGKSNGRVEATAAYKKTTDRGKRHFNFSSTVQGSIYLTDDQLAKLGVQKDQVDTATLEVVITVKQ